MIEKELKKILKGAKGCDPKSVMYAPRMNNIKKINKGRLFKIGKGQYGAVYYGCLDDKCNTKIAIKFTDEPSAKMEYTIAKKLRGMGVPEMYHFKTCDKRDVLYSEYIDGVPLETWMKSNPGVSEYKSIIRQIATNLYKIHKKYPDFRHHDLHWNNVMVTKDGKAVMIDFGFAVMDGIKNPTVNNGELLIDSGISRKSNPMYDLHYILYILHKYTHSKTIKDFINSLFKTPSNYLEPYTDYVRFGRLRLVEHKNLPTFENVINHPFLSEKKKPNTMKSILNFAEKTKPAPFQPITKKQLGSKEALEKAKQILAKNKMKKKPKLPVKLVPKPKSNSPKSMNNVPLAKLVPKPKSNSPKSMNNVPLAKLVPKPKSNSPKSMNNVPLAKLVTINKNNEVKIGRRKCRLYKKGDLVKLFNMNPKLSKSEMCTRIKNLVK
jgi:predicted Ser/Thr protein kinase